MLLEARELHKEYRLGRTTIPALRGVDLSIERGEFVSIMGPSGCGKTTLLNILGCIDRPTRGRLLFGGEDVAGLGDDQETDKRLKEIGFIFQSFNLVPVLTAAENIELPLVLAGARRSARKAKVEGLVESMGLGEYRNHRPDELSGGQRQRVAIARALANDPSLVIADEPTANLDSETGAGILEMMGRLNREAGVTFVFSTHNPEILRYAGRRIRLRDGLVVEDEGGPA